MSRSGYFQFVLLLCMAIAFFSLSASAQPSYDDERALDSIEVQSKIQSIFNNIEQIGNTYNSSGASAAGNAAIGTGCRAAVEHFVQTQLFSDLKDGFLPGDLDVPVMAREFISNKSQELGYTAFNSFCAALQGEELQGLDLNQTFKDTVRAELVPGLIHYGQGLARESGLPFLTRIEVQTGVTDRSFFSSITSVQPIWEDANDAHHFFAQVSWYNASSDKTSLGYHKYYDTFNAGLAYRFLTPNKNFLYGANVFFDHAPEMDHNRMSAGVDARTSQLAFSANRYFPVSDWRKLDLYYEEQAAGGWDMQFRGQVPELPSWTASAKAYSWDEQEKGKDLYGYVGTVEYSPVPALAVSVGVRDDSQEAASVEAALRFTWRFDQPQDLQLKPRTALAPVSSYVYEKVQRENLIRVKQQRRAESMLSVLQTVGANTAAEATSLSSLSVGRTLMMPVTVTVANTVGAVARLRFSDGSLLTLGQNTQVRIVPNLITLVFGTMQYVNNGAVQNVIVPGGTITLLGTDLDIVSDGANSSVRVRDGAVNFVGSVAGSVTLNPEEAAESVAGVIAPIAQGSPDYVAHTDTVSQEIDRVADPVAGPEVTPYPFEAPRVISSAMTVGGNIVFGLRFNDEVTVSGGTPRLVFTINGFTRTADYVSGSGTDDLVFSYTNTAPDISATSLTVTSFDKNGAMIMGNNKEAVTTIADATLAVSGTGDGTAPSGYTVAFTTDPVNDANKAAAAFTISSAEVGATFDYTISSSGGGTNVTGSGTITNATQSVTGLDLTGLGDGTLTVSVTLTDTSFNTGAAATDTVTKDIVAPSIVSVTAPANGIYEP